MSIRKNGQGPMYVYVVKSEGGPSKIGISFCPKERLKILQTGSPYLLSLVFFEQVDKAVSNTIEGAVHNKLKEKRMCGEWFDVPYEEAIATVKETIVDFLSTISPDKAKTISASDWALMNNLLKSKELV
jgi:Meiotically up-regulated gene 113